MVRLSRYTGEGKIGEAPPEEGRIAYGLALAIVCGLRDVELYANESKVLAIDGKLIENPPISVDSTLEFRVSDSLREVDPGFGIATCIWRPLVKRTKCIDFDPEYEHLTTPTNFGFCFMPSPVIARTRQSPVLYYSADLQYPTRAESREESKPKKVRSPKKVIILDDSSLKVAEPEEQAFLNGQRVTLQKMREYEESLLRKRKAI